MIRFTLKCDQGHSFDSWFKSAEAFDTLRAAGHLTCEVCGSPNVSKSLMAPQVRPARKAAGPLTSKEDPAEKKLAALRKKIEDNSDYVGLEFATKAREMHDGDTDHRPIYGEATAQDAKSLIEDGIPVAPLPFMPRRNTN